MAGSLEVELRDAAGVICLCVKQPKSESHFCAVQVYHLPTHPQLKIKEEVLTYTQKV